MGLCPCFGRKRSCSSKTTMNRGLETDADCNSDCLEEEAALASSQVTHSSYPLPPPPTVEPNKLKCALSLDSSHPENFAPTFTYRELAAATNNFRRECCIGEGGFGSVYKGLIPSTGQVVAVKKLDPLGVQGTKEFVVEVLMLSLLRHPNLINLVGFCAEGDQRLLVYEFLPLGSLEDHLHDLGPEMNPLDWNTRMKIAVGVAEGLDYLHNQADPPVIHRDLKSSNILLGKGFHPKLSDFGLAKFGPPEDKSHVSTRVMGTEGYCAPEYFDTGKLTAKSDIYCFGIVLLEIITGRRAKDETRENGRRNLHEWARPLLKDQSNYVQMVDERMEGRFPHSGLQLAMQVAMMCLRDVPTSRPSMNEVVTAMKFVLGKRVEPAGRDGWVRGSREIGEHDSITTDLIGAEDAGGGAATVEAARSSKKDEERERERAVAEAKLWGETCRAKMQLCAKGEFDNSNL